MSILHQYKQYVMDVRWWIFHAPGNILYCTYHQVPEFLELTFTVPEGTVVSDIAGYRMNVRTTEAEHLFNEKILSFSIISH